MMKHETFLVTRDVSQILNCTLDDVVDLAQEGKLKGDKQGRFWIFRSVDVMAYKERETEK